MMGTQMRLLDALLLRLRSLFRNTRVEQDLDDELRFHVEAHVEELVAKGISPEQARTTALRAFGGVEQVKESVRDTWHIRAIRDLMQDLRYGVRVLTKAPAFTTVAVLTLALGIGATTAIFSDVAATSALLRCVDVLPLKPLQYPDADRIVRVLTHFTETNHDGQNVSGGD